MKQPSNKIIEVKSQPVASQLPSQNLSKPGILIKTMNVFIIPAKSRYHQFYHPQKNAWWLGHLLADLALIALVGCLLALNIFLLTNQTDHAIKNYFDQGILILKKQPQLSLELKSERDNIKINEPTNYLIQYKNNGFADAADINIIINVNGELIGKKQIILDSLKYPELKKIASGQSGVIKYQTEFKQKIETIDNPNNYLIESEAEAEYQDPSGQKLKSTGNKLRQKVSADFQMSLSAKYRLAEGDQLGVGPIPPVVGQTTKYWIFMAVETNYNDLEDIRITASLPTNVKTSGKMAATSPQPIKLNPESNQISWIVDNLKAPSASYSQIGAALELELTPTEDQKGKTAVLLQNIAAKGRDKFTGEVIEIKIKNLDNRLDEESKPGIIQ